jgi:hypothetical protein
VQAQLRLGEGPFGRKLNEDATHFLNVLVFSDQVFVTQEVSETQFPGLALSLGAGVKRPIFGTQLLSRVACHPKSLFVSHPVCPRRIRTTPDQLTPNRDIQRQAKGLSNCNAFGG